MISSNFYTQDFSVDQSLDSNRWMVNTKIHLFNCRVLKQEVDILPYYLESPNHILFLLYEWIIWKLMTIKGSRITPNIEISLVGNLPQLFM